MIYIKDENGEGHWCPQRPDGSAIWLTKEEKRHCGNLNISSRIIEERLQEGWGEDDATTLKHELCYAQWPHTLPLQPQR